MKKTIQSPTLDATLKDSKASGDASRSDTRPAYHILLAIVARYHHA